MKKKIIKTITKYILLLVLIVFLCVAFFSTNWALDRFKFVDFESVLFTLSAPLGSASTEILNSYLKDCLIKALILSVFIFIAVALLINYLSGKRYDVYLKIWKKEFKHSFDGKKIRLVFKIMCFLLCIGVLGYCLVKMYIYEYFLDLFNPSPLIEDYYVDPEKVNITFPEEKRNLIYIYAESLESSFFSEDLGGVDENNYIEPLTGLTSSYINFSDTDKIGGAIDVKGTGWTSAAMVAQTSGLPLKNSLQSILGSASLLNGASSLGNILEENGYQQMLMIGSPKEFGNRGLYFASHGNVDIYDYNTAIEKGKIDKDYYEWWGFEDSKLFEFSKEEITKMADKGTPFSFSLLTTNTHAQDGFVEDSCELKFDDNKYGNALYCSSQQIADFISWIQQQDFYPNTTIILVGDHTSMQTDLYPEDANRRIYNLFINSAIGTEYNHNRLFTSMDLFPTTLASMGATIEGDRLGLGTNLYTGKKTIMEEIGQEKFEEEIEKYSKYYMDQFYQ